MNQADSDGMTPLMHAVRTNDARAVYGLFNPEALKDSFSGNYVLTFNGGIGVNLLDRRGFSALHHLVGIEPVNGGAEGGQENVKGVTATFDNALILKLLVERGADVHHKVRKKLDLTYIHDYSLKRFSLSG